MIFCDPRSIVIFTRSLQLIRIFKLHLVSWRLPVHQTVILYGCVKQLLLKGKAQVRLTTLLSKIVW